MSVKLIASIIVWNDERFLRPVLDAALAAMDEVWVTQAWEPWNACQYTRDKTADVVAEYSDRVKVITGNWPNETAQRNAAVPSILRSASGEPAYLVIIDADEIYDPIQLQNTREYLNEHRPTLAYVKQRVYFKHGNWLVEPDTHIAETFVLLHENFHFTSNRGNNSLTDKIINHIPEDLIVVHHFNTVGTYDEIREKHQAFSHANLVTSDWLERWRVATIDSKNLHQFVPELLPALRKVQFSELPSVCWPYKDSFLLDETKE